MLRSIAATIWPFQLGNAFDDDETCPWLGAAASAATRGARCGLDARSSFAAVARFMARTPSRMLVISAEDVLSVRDQVNMPGTIDEYPNWRRKLPLDLDDIATDGRLAAIADALAVAGRSSRTVNAR